MIPVSTRREVGTKDREGKEVSNEGTIDQVTTVGIWSSVMLADSMEHATEWSYQGAGRQEMYTPTFTNHWLGATPQSMKSPTLPARRFISACSQKSWVCTGTVSDKRIWAEHQQLQGPPRDLNWAHPYLLLFVLLFASESSANKIRFKVWQQLKLFIVIFIAAPMFICAFLFIKGKKKVLIQHCLGRMALKAAVEISYMLRAAVSNLCRLKNIHHVSRPCFFFYSFGERLEFHPIRCTQRQLFWIYLHANETLRSWFFRMKKGV